MISRYSSALNSWSVVAIDHDAVPSSMIPLGRLALAFCTARRISSSPISNRSSTVGLTLTRTAGDEPPLMTTCPTPGTCESFVCTIVAAASCN